MTAETLLSSELHGDRLSVSATGNWTAENAQQLEPLVDATLVPDAPARRIEIDVAKIDRLDTYGAWLLERAQRRLSEQGREAKIVGLRENYRGLFEKVHAGTQQLTPPPPREGTIYATLDSVGRIVTGIFDEIVLVLRMVGALIVATRRLLFRPWTFRLTSTINHLERVGWRAVPIVLLITFLIGAILAQQGIFHFRKFGADVFVIDMVGVLVLREVGVLIVCIMVAGRSGSAYTAELGSMKMREEVDALRTMGFDPVEVLVMPRVVALVIAVPVLTFLGSMAAIYGGALVTWLYGGVELPIFVTRLRSAISLDTFLVGMIKAPFMALVIGIIACVEGMQVQGSAESLGTQTTSSVVKSIFLVIVLDGIFAMIFASLGM